MSTNDKLSRRSFARLLTLSGSASLFPVSAFAQNAIDSFLLTEVGLNEETIAEELTLVTDTGNTLVTALAGGRAELITSGN